MPPLHRLKFAIALVVSLGIVLPIYLWLILFTALVEFVDRLAREVSAISGAL